MRFPGVVYAYYERKLRRSLAGDRIPEHIGVMVDGNRRWAKLAGAPTSDGHQAGADKILEFLGWCQEMGVRRVTLYMLSTDNLNRDADELEPLLDIIGNTLDRLGEKGDLRVNAVGALDILPANLADKLNALGRSTSDADGLHVNVAIGYGGRREIVDAVKELLNDAAAHGKTIAEITEELCDTQIAEYLYTRGQPDPELVIRTSGEQRLSGFLMWQSAYSEFYFCEALWPDFRRVDFLRALRDYASRQRRFGS
ncbi:isoprenyl transferase [Arthrobacter sp. zg-Y820]|uniref:isoprenyl transferase n=1 Tax=unclassified Arthrobacter TaxID=235627 RepID=UPI001E3876A7|nr:MULTISPECIES: isoprenyl transferase [unclassified Arthrobacter]MCC9195560.1 isoprenyl transferase [Arthrobacter sp. zg-Y820]MDK1278419.1 isoprenyl transferase [Arthrobacter sp. zg.Y820]MDK1360108.1 isoprenyl transferase [Arthrobacter sp. zg-Y1219]WIB10288.1 isoprenyl transferase [Arthrobacter sp. zg-Y820]